MNYYRNLPNLFLSALLALSVLTSCSSDEEPAADAAVPLVLTAKVFSIDSEVGTVWNAGQYLGVYLLDGATRQVAGEYANYKFQADNRGATGYLVPADNQPVYFPDDAATVDVLTYYPYSQDVASAGHLLTVNVDAYTKGDAYLYSKNCTSLTKAKNKGTIELRSILSQVNLKFVCEVPDATKVNIEITDAVRTAMFDLLAGEYQSTPAATRATFSFDVSSSLIEQKITLLPDYHNEDALVYITLLDSKNKVLVSYEPIHLHDALELSDEPLEENTAYHLTVALDGSGKAETQLTGTSEICILNWKGSEEGAESGIARPEEEN
ncbi:MAG: fimbrillin family protein [Mediterranea massiliensis]|nr:fimbrillin family protein [Mediterranea massiliensis]